MPGQLDAVILHLDHSPQIGGRVACHRERQLVADGHTGDSRNWEVAKPKPTLAAAVVGFSVGLLAKIAVAVILDAG